MINNNVKYNLLQNEFQEFHYVGFDYVLNDNELSIEFLFKIDNVVEFRPKMSFVKSDLYHFGNLPAMVIESLIFNIGMVELVSYWKSLVPKKIIIHGYRLNQTQLEFWRKLYFHGLGEFFYLNGITPNYEQFIEFKCLGNNELESFHFEVSDDIIIPVGGGKDSVVTLELMKNFSANNLALIMNPRGASLNTAKIGGFDGRILEVKRTIDKELLRLNEEGYLNGHTPFSALLAFTTVLAAAGSGRKYIALSNEGSANEPTIAGTKINHQYSKSIEFETDFRNYIQQNISTNIQYFSLLRPLSEIQIASIFAQSPQYFTQFRSCNVGSKTDSWCGKCPKCLFTFIILSPFLDPAALESIFGGNLLNDKDLTVYFEELTGIAEIKPFECIGTVEEVNIALCLTLKKYNKLPYLLEKYHQTYSSSTCKEMLNNFDLTAISSEHFLESEFLQIIHNSLSRYAQ